MKVKQQSAIKKFLLREFEKQAGMTIFELINAIPLVWGGIL